MNNGNQKLSVILLAAGKGTRFKSTLPKQFVKLNHKELITWSLIRIEKLLPFKELILGCESQYQKKIIRICKRHTPQLLPLLNFSQAGKTRQETVFNAVTLAQGETLFLHETARPCASLELYKKVLNDPFENITTAEEIPFTVLQKQQAEDQKFYISAKLERDSLFNVQLPQKFNRKALLKAHQQATEESLCFTDDSSLLFYYGEKVKVIKGEPDNIKITHPQDLSIASQILKKRKNKI